MEDRFPITPAEGNPNSIFIWFKGTAVTGIYDRDPETGQVRCRGLTTDSYALQQENRLAHEVGRGRLSNALERAKKYFAAKHERV